MDQYINICTTNTKATSATYFIRKASGQKVSQYNITVSDWYSDNQDEMPDFLEPYQNSLISDFFAEIYVFGTKFTANQVLASSTLKKYFEVATEDGHTKVDENGNVILQLVNHVTDAYGDWVDTLDELYKDETSHAIGHYVGCLIPEFKDKKGNYVSLDIQFNQEQYEHNMMMSFNTDMIYEEETASIDLSGRLSIATSNNATLNLEKLFDGEAKTNLLGNNNSKVITNKIKFVNNVVKYNAKTEKYEPVIELNESPRKVMGTLYVSNFDPSEENTALQIEVRQVGASDKITIKCSDLNEMWQIGLKLGAAFETTKNSDGAVEITTQNNQVKYVKKYEAGYGSYYPIVGDEEAINDSPFIDADGQFKQEGPQKVITSIARIEPTSSASIYTDLDKNMKISLLDVIVTMENTEDDSVYGSSVTFIPVSADWNVEATKNGAAAAISSTIYENTLYSILSIGDCLVADDGTNEDVEEDGFYDNVYVQNIDCEYDGDGNIAEYYITFSGTPKVFTDDNQNEYFVRIDNSLNQEIGDMVPKYLEGYTYENSKPESASMLSKLNWQKFILSALTTYKGLRTGLLNKADIDYRYIVDTFDSYVDSSIKKTLSFLCKEKENAFAILNFPAVKTFVKCPYTSFTNSEGVFDVNYIKEGYNKKKATSIKFSLPDDTEGASFCAFYTPLKFSDGYVDTIVPAAGLVSNLFMKKYTSRQPYYVIAGPKYGLITATGLIGPEYNYSKEELYVMEPYGVNCIIFKKGFGTFINSNQTAKQTPVSALSKVNIRELVIYLQDEIEKIMQANQWEFNNPTTRNLILDKANKICGRVAANGGIEAYYNQMDENNNTDELIENEFAILSTSIEPGFGCGKMVQELTLYRRGFLKARITES